MAITKNPAAAKLSTFVVLRAICIAGERVEVDSLVDLGPVIGAELKAAAKVRPATEEEVAAGVAGAEVKDATVAKVIEPAPVVRTRAKRAEAESEAGAAAAPAAGAPAEAPAATA